MSSLVVNTNQSAINAFNNLNSTDNAMTKAISELSSGLADPDGRRQPGRLRGGRGPPVARPTASPRRSPTPRPVCR